MHLIPHSIRQHLPLVKYNMNLIIADNYCHCTTKSYFCKIPVVFTIEKDTEVIRCHTFGFIILQIVQNCNSVYPLQKTWTKSLR